MNNSFHRFRLSRARRIVENAFGIMSHTWRILLSRIHTDPVTANNIVLACCVLHNYLRMKEPESSENSDDSDDEDVATGPLFTTQSASTAYDIRERVCDWCVNEGEVDFQHNMI